MAVCIVRDFTKTALITVFLLIMGVACNRAAPQPPSYGVKTQYTQGQPLNFPDITLEFVGKRESPASAEYPRSMTVYDFKVYQGSRAQLVSWSAGTGDIGPTLFEVTGNRYALELAMSDKLGALDEDELALWQTVISATKAPTVTSIPTLDAPPREAQDYYDKGLAQFAAGLNEEAVTNFTQAITLYLTYIEAYQYRGHTYRELGRYDLARADYQQVLDLDPQPEVQATFTAALQEIAQAKTITTTPTPTPILVSPTPMPSPPVKIKLGQPFTLTLNQYGRLEATGLGVQFYEIIEDTRCPRQVLCTVAGEARIAIYVWITDVEPVEFILSTSPADNKDVLPYDEYQIRLLALDPYPETPEEDIALEDYRATFVVSK